MSDERAVFNGLYDSLRDMGLLEYGAFIPEAFVLQRLDIEMPASAPKSVYDAIALRVLGAVDYVRQTLLNQGKYIGATPGGYRIFLPSENKLQAELYMKSADRKLKRARKLIRNTPGQPGTVSRDQTDVRMHLKQAGRRSNVDDDGAAITTATDKLQRILSRETPRRDVARI